MKKPILILMLALVLAGGALGGLSTPAGAQVYPPPPQNLYATPWVGANTPWVYYNGDWFLNGVLYYFFGPRYGWAPYYSYAPTYIVRPQQWYAPRWNVWYQKNPHYWANFQRQYPYWREHRHGHHYGESFYNKYHRGQGIGWHKGFSGGPPPGGPPPGKPNGHGPHHER
jgi:hypothetical protein